MLSEESKKTIAVFLGFVMGAMGRAAMVKVGAASFVASMIETASGDEEAMRIAADIKANREEAVDVMQRLIDGPAIVGLYGRFIGLGWNPVGNTLVMSTVAGTAADAEDNVSSRAAMKGAEYDTWKVFEINSNTLIDVAEWMESLGVSHGMAIEIANGWMNAMNDMVEIIANERVASN